MVFCVIELPCCVCKTANVELCAWLQNCYEALEDKLKEFVDNYKFIAIGIAIGICVIEVSLLTSVLHSFL